jgi:hypothetical protein
MVTAVIPLHTPDLEQVVEISVEPTFEAEDPPVSVVVAQANSLVENPLPKELGAIECDDVPRQRVVLPRPDVGVRQVNTERCIIILMTEPSSSGRLPSNRISNRDK